MKKSKHILSSSILPLLSAQEEQFKKLIPSTSFYRPKTLLDLPKFNLPKINLLKFDNYTEMFSCVPMFAEKCKRLTNIPLTNQAIFKSTLLGQHIKLHDPSSFARKALLDISRRTYNSLYDMEQFNLVSTLGLPLSELIAIGIDPYDYSYETDENDEEGDEETEIESSESESVDNKSTIIKLDENGHVEVCLRSNNGSWTYIDGNSLLPADIYVIHPNWNNILKELENIINDPKTKERDFQKFLEENPELLKEDKYNMVIPQACIVSEDRLKEKPWQADFILAPVDQNEFCKILELKEPKTPIIRKKRSGHQEYSSQLWKAIKQLKDYKEAFHASKTRSLFHDKYGIEAFKPDLHLIIGRDWGNSCSKEMLILQREQFVKIDNWDSYARALKRKFK